MLRKYGIAKLGIHQQFSFRLWKATRRAKAFFRAGTMTQFRRYWVIVPRR